MSWCFPIIHGSHFSSCFPSGNDAPVVLSRLQMVAFSPMCPIRACQRLASTGTLAKQAISLSMILDGSVKDAETDGKDVLERRLRGISVAGQLDGAGRYSMSRKNKLFNIGPSQRGRRLGRGAEMMTLLSPKLQ